MLVEARHGAYNPWDEIEFQTQYDYTLVQSPTLWTQTASKDNQPYTNHHPSSTIEDCRRQLMEMIKNMPESSLELSLKDIVVHDQVGAEEDEDASVSSKKEKVQIKEKCRSFQHDKMSRSESMESGVFLLKMFVPASLYSKKKANPKNYSKSKISPNPPFKDQSEKPVSKSWWKTLYLCIKENTYSMSSASIKQKRRLQVESSNLLNESSFESNRYKSRNQRGCLF